jgi:hypothetical protein
MLEDAMTGDADAMPRCMWCSAPLATGTEVTCPTCGAKLVGEGDDVPGVTAIDPAAIVSGSRAPKPQKRSRWMSWISGDYVEEDKPAPPGSLAPPPAAVRREMLRLELEAHVANLQGEASAIAANQAVEAIDAGAAPEAAAAEAAAVIAAADDAVDGKLHDQALAAVSAAIDEAAAEGAAGPIAEAAAADADPETPTA